MLVVQIVLQPIYSTSLLAAILDFPLPVTSGSIRVSSIGMAVVKK